MEKVYKIRNYTTHPKGCLFSFWKLEKDPKCNTKLFHLTAHFSYSVRLCNIRWFQSKTLARRSRSRAFLHQLLLILLHVLFIYWLRKKVEENNILTKTFLQTWNQWIWWDCSWITGRCKCLEVLPAESMQSLRAKLLKSTNIKHY